MQLELEINLGSHKSVEVKFIQNQYLLFLNDIKWMGYKIDDDNHELKETISHYELSTGNVITTGLGLGLTEQILLSKPEVKSLTVLEKSQDLIDYHLLNSKWAKNPKLKMINTDASVYKGSCDTLLLYHYAHQEAMSILNNVKAISKNIKCETMWFWPLESFIVDRKSTRLNSSHVSESRMPSSA